MLENEMNEEPAKDPVNTADGGGAVKATARPRRKAASRPAGPPPEPEEIQAAEAGPEPRSTSRSGRRGASKSGLKAALDEVPPAVAEEIVDEAGDAPEEVPVKRTRTRSRTRKRPEAPAPVEAEAETAAEEPGVVEVEEEEIFPPTAAVPTVTFQPPMVVFQPPVALTTVETRPAPAPAPAQAAADEAEAADEDESDDGDESGRGSRRRRRRGGRGRGKAAKDTQDEEQSEPAAEKEEAQADEAESADAETGSDEETDTEGDGDGQSGSSRRRRRRRRRSGSTAEDIDQDLPPNTVVHVRSARSEDRAPEDEVQSVRGSTRLEAKKQRRREGREQGRRRPPIITESEFLARRESVERIMVVRSVGDRTQIAVLEDGVLVEHHVDRASHQSYVGNVYLGKVQNVLPSMEAAFVDVGKGRNAVLYAGEVNWDVAGLEGQPRRIESALKSGQSVLVQVTKDPVGHKGARLTSQISLPGRYLVYVPDGSMTGISRKLPDKERTRLKSILKKVMPENAGVIVRTAAEGASEEELSQDVSRLAAQWEHIKTQSKSASAPSLLHGEPDLTIRVVRDIFNEDFTKLVVAGADAWDTVEEYVNYVAPHLADRVTRWTEGADVFDAYRIDEQLGKALERKVWLPSGGSLVIDRTEAMTVIDVNTGKFTGQGGNLEETVTRNNLEAAEEIVRQLRLRDVGGIIVVDFIDMVLESNRDLVLRRLLECLSRDRTKHQVAEVTSLGLVQMTRKRVGTGLLEAFSEPCECCNGRGIHVTLHPEDAKEPSGSAEEKSEGGGRRRKRKGEVEKAVESKLARHEAAKAAEAAKIAEVAMATVAQQEAPEVVSAAVVEEEPVKPKRTPRRARVTKPAGPPPEDEGQDAVLVVPGVSTGSDGAGSDGAVSGGAASDGAASGEAETPGGAGTPEGAETPTEAAVAAVEAVEEAPAATRTRTRRTRRTTRAKAEVGAEEAVGEA